MKRVFLLFVIIIITACTSNPSDNTNPIAGYWSGTVFGVSNTGDELPEKEVGILIISGCTSGNVCGKFSEDGFCPGDIILLEVNGNRYSFSHETAIGFRQACGKGSFSKIDLALRVDGKVDFIFHNGNTYTGLLEMGP